MSVSKPCMASKHWWQLKVLCGLCAPPSIPHPHLHPHLLTCTAKQKLFPKQKRPRLRWLEFSRNPGVNFESLDKWFIPNKLSVQMNLCWGRTSNAEPQADPWALAPDPFIPSSGVLILLKSLRISLQEMERRKTRLTAPTQLAQAAVSRGSRLLVSPTWTDVLLPGPGGITRYIQAVPTTSWVFRNHSPLWTPCVGHRSDACMHVCVFHSTRDHTGAVLRYLCKHLK